MVGAARRSEAKGSGQAVGAVNVLLVNARGEVLLQRRPDDKENGGLWDKSVGGHVSAGEEFDATAVREAGEELFDDGASPRVRLASSDEAFAALLATTTSARTSCSAGPRSSSACGTCATRPGARACATWSTTSPIYLGRTDVPRDGFRPQADEIADLAYFDAARGRRDAAPRRARAQHGVPVADPRSAAAGPGRAGPLGTIRIQT